MVTARQFIIALGVIPSPSHPALKRLFQSPIWMWRLGLGALVGQLFLILTTRRRKSGLPRRTAIEYHTYQGRNYVVAAWPQSDWYQNLLADPHVTIQTAQEMERARARRLTSDEELRGAFRFAEQSPVMRQI